MDKVINNRYEIWEKLGSGGFANVFHGWDLLRDREIAIKIIMTNLAEDEKLKAMFLDEGHMAGRLDHANIVHLYDIGQTADGLCFLVMEFIDGYDLTKVLQQTKKRGEILPLDLSCFIVMQICSALEYAHTHKDLRTGQSLNMVHRDVTPANILISKTANVKLTDFGIAKAAFGRREETRVGELKGKLTYMSPEQALGNNKPLDCRSDIFSLGIVFYEMLTGLYAYEGSNEMDIHRKVLKAEFDRESLNRRNIPDQIQKVVLQAMQRAPEERFASARDMHAAVEAFTGARTLVQWQNDLQNCLSHLFETSQRTTASAGEDPERTQRNIADRDPQTASGDTVTAVMSSSRLDQASLEKDKTVQLVGDAGKHTGGESDADRTRLDIIIDAFRYHKKIVRWISAGLFSLFMVFLALDSFMHWTPMGRRLYYWFVRPNIIIESVPAGAQVFIDGRLQEYPTPLPVKLDPLHTHPYQLQLPGYETAQGLIPILTGVDTTYIKKVYFEALVSFTSTPSNARIYLQNVLIGSTPTTQRLQIGKEYPIRYEHAGFNSLSGRFNLFNQPSIWDMNSFYWKTEIIASSNSKQFQIRGDLHKDVRFTIRPSGAVLRVDNGQEVAVEDAKEVKLTADQHQVEAAKSGWQTHRYVLAVDENTGDQQIQLMRNVRFQVRAATAPATELNDASITIVETGRTQSAAETFLLGPQRYSVRVAHAGYVEKRIQIPAESFQVPVTLELSPPILNFIVVDDATGKPLDGVGINWRRDILYNLGLTQIDGTLTGVEIPVNAATEIYIVVRYGGYLLHEITQRIIPGKAVNVPIRLKKIP